LQQHGQCIGFPHYETLSGLTILCATSTNMLIGRGKSIC
jgi:hypothetical protein